LRSLSILIPAYNEERRLPSTLQTLAAFLAARSFDFLEVAVINDGSRDSTAELVRASMRDYPWLRLIENPGNRGKGYAVRHGMEEAKGKWILFTDADLSSPIEELEKLWDAVQRENADGAIGSRALDRSLVGVHQALPREMMGRFFNLHMRLVTGLPYRDTQCGFKLFSARACRTIVPRQRSERFGFDVEILYILRRHGLRIVEVPVRWDNVEGTKINLLNGLEAFTDPWKARWNDWRGRYR